MHSKRTETLEMSRQQVTRREFVKSTALGGGAVMAAAMGGPVAGQLPDMPVTSNPNPPDELEEALRRYGSEFGDLRKSN